jgi:DNA mismatch repair protein PMS2
LRDVKLKNSGYETIEVQDNGNGIAPVDFESIALKHYTSKLTTYDDLGSLDTFGFRGEALSSMSAVSNLAIVTAQASDGPKGTRLDFETSGKIKSTKTVATTKGTTVIVENIFKNLPVRRKELERNLKREYQKVLNLLNAYACISVGVRFIVSNMQPKAYDGFLLCKT